MRSEQLPGESYLPLFHRTCSNVVLMLAGIQCVYTMSTNDAGEVTQDDYDTQEDDDEMQDDDDNYNTDSDPDVRAASIEALREGRAARTNLLATMRLPSMESGTEDVVAPPDGFDPAINQFLAACPLSVENVAKNAWPVPVFIPKKLSKKEAASLNEANQRILNAVKMAKSFHSSAKYIHSAMSKIIKNGAAALVEACKQLRATAGILKKAEGSLAKMTPELCVLKSNKSHSDDVIAMMKTAQTKSNREISKLEKEVAELKKELKATKDGKEDTVDMYAKRKEIDFEAHIAKKRAEIKLQEEKEAKKLSA